MKRWIFFYRALQTLCVAIQLGLFLYAAALCVRMSGGYAGGWSASYCLPRILGAALGIIGLDKLFDQLGDWVETEKEYAAICRKELLYSGYLSTQYSKTDGRNGRTGGAA